jgi:hypothetical protein
MGWGHLKIFSRSIGPIITRLDTNYPWVKGIQICSKEGDSSSPRGDNSKSKNTLKIFKIKSSPEPACQNQSNLVRIILG